MLAIFNIFAIKYSLFTYNICKLYAIIKKIPKTSKALAHINWYNTSEGGSNEIKDE